MHKANDTSRSHDRPTPAMSEAVRRPLPMPHHPLHRFYNGGAATRRFRRLRAPVDSAWSEDWVGSTTTASNAAPDGKPQGVSPVALQDGTRCTLAELVAAHPEEVLGRATVEAYGPVTGLLVKILSPAGSVPLHAHPTASWARQHLDSCYGKTEGWVLLDSPPADDGSPAYAGIGFRGGVTRDWVAEAVARRDHVALRESLHRVPITAGEVYVADGGVPHLLGPRLLFLELQEPTDHIVIPETDGTDDDSATMGLGWQLALDMIDYTPRTEVDTLARARQHPTVARREGKSTETDLFEPRVRAYFSARRLQVADTITVADDRFAVLIVTAGDGHLEGDFPRVPVAAGDAFVVPAGAPHRLHAGSQPLTAVRCLGPDPEAIS